MNLDILLTKIPETEAKEVTMAIIGKVDSFRPVDFHTPASATVVHKDTTKRFVVPRIGDKVKVVAQREACAPVGSEILVQSLANWYDAQPPNQPHFAVSGNDNAGVFWSACLEDCEPL